MSEARDRPTDEAEVTEAMIRAGVEAWFAYNFLDAEQRVEVIYEAMHKAGLRKEGI